MPMLYFNTSSSFFVRKTTNIYIDFVDILKTEGKAGGAYIGGAYQFR